MASRSAIQKLQDVVVGTVKGAVKDPVGTAGKAVRQAKGGLAVGRAFVDQVSRTATHRPGGGATGARTPEAATTPTPASEPEGTPSDVARVVQKKATAKKATAKTTAAKKTATKKSTPSAKLPAKKAPAKKSAPTKTAAKKTAAKKSPARKTAAEVVEDSAQEVRTPVGTTAADSAVNPDTADTSLQQPGTEPLMDPATTKAVASEAETGSRAADPEKG